MSGSRKPARGRRWRLRIAVVAALGLSWACGEERQRVEPAADRSPVEVRATVDPAVATTGDLITYRIAVDYEPGYEVEVPEAGSEIAGFRIVELGRAEPRQARGRMIAERWYELRADLVGSYVLPPVTIRFRSPVRPGDGSATAAAEASDWQELSTSEIFVEVESVLPAGGQAADIRDLKPLRRIPSPWPWAWIGGSLAALLVAAIAGWLYLRHRARRGAAPLAVPPHELAFAELAALRDIDLEDAAAVRRFYFRISEILRAYVEGRFELNATDLTSEEIVALLPGLGGLEAEQSTALQRFLLATDRVKFAHHAPSPAEIEGVWETALRFVETTCPAAPQPELEAA